LCSSIRKPRLASTSCRPRPGLTGKNWPHISRIVRNGTAWLPSRCHNLCMLHKKSKTKSGATYASVKKEMAKPRMARSARVAELNLDTAKAREQPSTTAPGIVDKIIPSPRASQPEKAQTAIDRAERPPRDFRIESTLTDEHGDNVKQKRTLTLRLPPQPNQRRTNSRSS
jgi:hypothetical protein